MSSAISITSSDGSVRGVSDVNPVSGANAVSDANAVSGANAVSNANTASGANAVSNANAVSGANAVSNANAASRNKPPCKGCSADVNVTDAQIARVLAALDAHPDDCVDDERYEQRLAACHSCASFVYGSTCQHCGCFVAVRAKFKDKSCPLPGNARW